VASRDNIRKRRTREHVIAALSSNYLERFIVEAGYICEAARHDYGYDLSMLTFDEAGYVEESHVYIQLKATDSLSVTEAGIVFGVDVRDYNLRMKEHVPVFLIVYDAIEKRAFWLYVQNYFGSEASRRPREGARTVRVYIPLANEVGIEFPRYARQCKMEMATQIARRLGNHE
jgi:hypothetical protein